MPILALLLGGLLIWLASRSGSDATDDASGWNSFVMTDTSKPKSKLQDWAESIFRFESGGSSTSVAARNNNPGNLRDPKTGAFRIFGSFADGEQALLDDLSAKVRKYPNFTLLQIMQRYLGQDPTKPAVATKEGDPRTYAAAVARDLGVSPNDKLRDIFGQG